MTAVDAGSRLLHRLASGGPITDPVAIVVAHQDDEMIAAAGTMARLLDLTLIHVTDGAALDGTEWRDRGFARREDYAELRRRELDAALAAAAVRPVRRLCYDIPDRAVAARRGELVERLAADLMSVDVVITHPYENGHVDHDACAHATHDAVARLARLTGRAPSVLEFAGYFRRHGDVCGGVFWPDPACPEVVIQLTPAASQRRAAAFDCFASQANNLRFFGLRTERFRRAPSYDFSRVAPPGLSG